VRAVAQEQIESLWPVHGSVLVHEGIAYVAAGRSSYLDGGIELYGLDPATGAVRHTARIASEPAGAQPPPSKKKQEATREDIRQNSTDYKTFLAPDRSDAFSMRGALTDLLVAEGGTLFLRHLRFDGALRPDSAKRPHLFSTSSLLDDSEHHRSYWVLGTADFRRTPVAYPWIVTKSLAVPYGLMMSFDAGTVWAARRGASKGLVNTYDLLCMPRPDPRGRGSALPDFQDRPSPKAANSSWKVGLGLRPRAMLRAGNALILGGMPISSGVKRGGNSGSVDADSDSAGLLMVFSSDSGATLGRVVLAAPPVWDGLAATPGQLYGALEDGSVVSLGGEPGR
jgi:hypothetical protein